LKKKKKKKMKKTKTLTAPAVQVVRPFAREGGVGYGNIGRVVELAIQEVQVRDTLTTL
jgi:hypothetical protein